jgi:hypothetical protein
MKYLLEMLVSKDFVRNKVVDFGGKIFILMIGIIIGGYIKIWLF